MHRNAPLDTGRAGTSESPNHSSGVLLCAAFTHDRPNLHCASGMPARRCSPRTEKPDLP